jgi:hypothetical protein
MTISFRALALGAALLAAPVVAQAATKTYQVTGPIVEVTDSAITVQKGKEKWEISRDKDTKVTGDLKVGSKVTIEYRMSAATIEAKGDAKADKAAKGDKAEKADKGEKADKK